MNKTAACYITVTEYQINIKPVMLNLIKLTRTGSLSIKKHYQEEQYSLIFYGLASGQDEKYILLFS